MDFDKTFDEMTCDAGFQSEEDIIMRSLADLLDHFSILRTILRDARNCADPEVSGKAERYTRALIDALTRDLYA